MKELKSVKKVLKNGIVVLTEKVDYFPSITFGIWIRGGSRTERKKINGATHFIEHMVFKGSKRFHYKDVYKTFDRMGGMIDAFTSREIMGFYFRVHKKHFKEAFEIFTDIIFNPSFEEEEIERERRVIIEEIKMVNDTPPDVAADIFMQKVYHNNPLGYPIQGDEETIKGIKRLELIKRHNELIRAKNLIITVSGDIDDVDIYESLKKSTKALDPLPEISYIKAKFHSGWNLIEKNHLEQSQILVGFEGEKASSPLRYPLIILANILGGTMSSRLFSELREKKGLVYSISAENISQIDTGIFVIQAASSPCNTFMTVKEIFNVIKELKKNGPSMEELEIAKENIIGGTILSLESTSYRMGRMARNELYFGRQIDIKEVIEKIEKVTLNDIKKCAKRLFDFDKMNFLVLGKKKVLDEISKERLGIDG